MEIILKRMSINHFKGIKNLDIDFEHITDIAGDNATGKTTVFDAFCWLLFGKDSADRKDFEIKPLDANGIALEKTENEVIAHILADDDAIELKRIHREKWVTKRGEAIPVFQGNETLFFWNDVPMQAGDYQSKISSLINEGIFKLITNTLYFNSIKWDARRTVLMELAGTITNADVAGSRPDFLKLVASMGKKTLDEYKKEITSKKKKLKDELVLIPARIDELNRSLSNLEEVDFESIEREVELTGQELELVDNMLMNKSKAEKDNQLLLQSKQSELHTLRMSLKDHEFKLTNSAKDSRLSRENAILVLKRTMRTASDKLHEILGDLTSKENRFNNLLTKRVELRSRWTKINAEVFIPNQNEFKCPACNRAFETDDIEATKATMLANFNADKKNRLDAANVEGKAVRRQIDELHVSIEKLKEEKTTIDAEMADLQLSINKKENEHAQLTNNEAAEISRLLRDDTDIKSISYKISLLESEIDAVPKTDNSDLFTRKRTTATKLDGLKSRLSSKSQIEGTRIRIRELDNQNRDLAQQLADLEGTEFTIEAFAKAKINMMEERVNGKFKYVTFKMFNTLINGGVEATCETMVDGVPYSSLNTAARINAGIDIINALCEHYGVYAPVFIDNRESVVKLLPCRSQIVNLIVREGVKKLSWKSRQAELTM